MLCSLRDLVWSTDAHVHRALLWPAQCCDFLWRLWEDGTLAPLQMSSVHGHGPLQDVLPQWAHTLHPTTHTVTPVVSYVWSERTWMWMCVFLTRWCKAWGPWGRPWDGEHGICLWPLPGAHCGQQDQLQRMWRLWPVLRLLPCKEVSRQVTYFKFNHILFKPTYFVAFSWLFLFSFFTFNVPISSHLPTHRITVYPMVTIRISDRHRLIQPYIHNYSWLLFAALALHTSELSSEKQIDGEALSSDTLNQASALQTCCSQLITDCLLKGQTGKGRLRHCPSICQMVSQILLSCIVTFCPSITNLRCNHPLRSALLGLARSSVVQWLRLWQWAVSSLSRVLSGAQHSHWHLLHPRQHCSNLLPILSQGQGEEQKSWKWKYLDKSTRAEIV